MDQKNVQNQSMRLVLSTDAKPRLKWTPELHQRFAEAIHQLGGAESKCGTKLTKLLYYFVIQSFSLRFVKYLTNVFFILCMWQKLPQKV